MKIQEILFFYYSGYDYNFRPDPACGPPTMHPVTGVMSEGKGQEEFSYDDIVWRDSRPKPSLEHLQQLGETYALLQMRKIRDNLLDSTDKFAVSDYPHPSEEVKQAWLDYRQALRDLPANTADPENPVWPQAPTP